MKGLTLLLVMLMLWYFAGMFHQVGLMILAVCFLLFPLAMFILLFYQKKRLNITLEKPKIIAFKKIEKEIGIRADNDSRLPVNRYRVKMRLRYTTDKNILRKKLGGCAGQRSMNEENLSFFYLQAPYCGVIDLQLTRWILYDPLSIFSVSHKLNETGQILVFPVEKSMHIELPADGRYDNLPVSETHSNKPGDDHSEVRLIREYRPGDLSRHIHQNYSARTDTLWVKEFSKENDHIIDLLLDTSPKDPGTDGWDAFYEIIFSLLLSLLKKDIYSNVHWYDAEKNSLVTFQVSNDTDAAETLARLYLTDTHCTTESLYHHLPAQQEGLMILNTDLEWYFAGQPIYHFHKEIVEEELSTLVFRL